MKRFLAPFVALVALTAPVLAQTRALPPGEIRANGDITFGNTLKLGKREAGKTIITPDTLQILGTGSVGDIRGMSALGAGSVVRTLSDRFAERASVLDYGADPTGVADSTAAFNTALNSGRSISAPCGTFRLVSTVVVTSRTNFEGVGNCTLLKFDLPAGRPVLPAMDIQKTAAGSSFTNFRLDHQAHVKGYTPNTVYGTNIIASSAILVQSDDTTLSRLTVDNAYDNCIAVVQFSGTGFTFNPGNPKRYSLKTIRTSGCGVGSTPKAGAGVDITGSFGTLDDLVDIGSYGAFILDVGGGGQGHFSNMTGIYTKVDPASHSYTFYIGNGNSTFTNLYSQEAADGALWLDGFAGRTTMNNIVIKAPKGIGAQIKAGDVIISNMVINSAGYSAPANTVDAIQIDSSANTTANILINGLSIQNEFNNVRYGINRLGTGTLSGAVVNANLSGATTATNNLPTTFGVVDGTALGNVMTGAWTTYTPTVTCGNNGQSLASTNGTAQFRRIGRTYSINVGAISIVDRGTCTGSVNVSLPTNSSFRSTFIGQETAVNGLPLIGLISEGTNYIQIKRNDGSTPAVNGFVLTGRAEYQSQ